MAPLSHESVAAAEKYYIGDAILKPAAHHESFQKLWDTKWKVPVRIDSIGPKSQADKCVRCQCAMGVYPFMFGSLKDFEPVVEEIIKVCNTV